jgi:ribosomal-protein-alanine N-acetyltransferase
MDLEACRIRTMRADDLETIVALEQRLQSHPWHHGHFENCLANGNLALVVTTGEEGIAEDAVIAFAIVSMGGGEAELLNLGVDPAYQRQGIASRLLGEILQHIKSQADTIFLEVRVSNYQAIDLYDKLGFNQVGIRPNYYNTDKGREDALLYALALI